MQNRIRRKLALVAALFLRVASGAAAPAIVTLAVFASTGHAALVPPVVVGVDTSASATADFSLPAGAMHWPVTQLRIRFDQPMTSGFSNPASAQWPGNFRVLSAGNDGVVSTSACSPLPLSDDVVHPVAEVSWEASNNEVSLRLAGDRGLPRGSYRLLACGSMAGAAGLALDGDGDGNPGGDASHDFRIAVTSQLANPGFGAGTSGWIAQPLGAGIVDFDWVAIDADQATASGAARVAGIGAAVLRSTDCVVTPAVVFPPAGRHRLQLRYRVVTGRVVILSRVITGFAGDSPGPGEPPCVGPFTGIAIHTIISSASPFTDFDSGERAADGPLNEFEVQIIPLDGEHYEVLFDDIGLTFDTFGIFRGNFEDR